MHCSKAIYSFCFQ